MSREKTLIPVKQTIATLADPQFSAGTLCILSSNPLDQALRKGFTGRTERWLGVGHPDLNAITKSLLLLGGNEDTL